MQVLAFSATYTPDLQQKIESLMHRPQRVLLASETTSLLGVRQFYKLVPCECLLSSLLYPVPCSANGRWHTEHSPHDWPERILNEQARVAQPVSKKNGQARADSASQIGP